MLQSIDRRGLAAALAAFIVWGLFPLYWYLLREIPPMETVAHRVVWSSILVVPWLVWRGGAGWFFRAIAQPRVLPMLCVSSILISINWGLYLWSVTHGHVVETSLGYYINPLVNVLLGVLILKERLNPMQWAAMGLAALGVLYMTVSLGAPPWISLTLAITFGLYGLLRKLVTVDAATGLGIENVLLFLPAAGWLLWSELHGTGAFGHVAWDTTLLLIVGGAITAVPLIGFAYAARRIPYTVVGLLQYITPTLQLLCGVLFFHEPFTADRAVGFALIWLALLLYAVEGLWRIRRMTAAAV